MLEIKKKGIPEYYINVTFKETVSNRSTPRVDTLWGGHDDITAASGYEENGVTTILFRKKIKVGDDV